MNYLKYNLIAICFGLIGSGLHAEDRLIPKKILNEFLSADNALDRWDAGNDLFEKVDHVQLLKLKHHDSDDVAAAAAYRVLRKSELEIISGEALKNIPREDGEIVRRYKDKTMGRFMGFLEGRLKTEILNEWEECMPKMTFYKDYEDRRGNKQVLMAYNFDSMHSLFNIQNNYVHNLKGQSLVQVKGKTFLEIGKQRVPINKEFLQSKSNGDTLNAFGTIQDGRCIVLFVSDFTLSDYVIVSLDPKSGAVQWRNTVWSSSVGGGSGLPMAHLAVPVIDRSKVFVYGASGGGIYLESFNLKNGAPLNRFGTSY